MEEKQGESHENHDSEENSENGTEESSKKLITLNAPFWRTFFFAFVPFSCDIFEISFAFVPFSELRNFLKKGDFFLIFWGS